MKILNRFRAIILYNRIKKLDSKYFATLCEHWQTCEYLDNTWCFPYDPDNPYFGHNPEEAPISVGLRAMIQKGSQNNNSIVLRYFDKADERLIRKYVYLMTGNDHIVLV